MRYTEIRTIAKWKEVLERTTIKPAVVFKHSTRCPISASALEEYEHYVEDEMNTDVDYYYVRVVESRPVSNAIAADLAVQHQSPQIIYVHQQQALWHESHWKITYTYFIEQLGGQL